MARSVYDSRKWTVVSQTHCPSFLWVTPSLEPKRENLLLVLRWMVLPSSSVSLVLVVSLSCHWSKRPEDWEESIFVRHKERGYRLRDNIHFHMYISTSPCGDGRLNSPYEITSDSKKSACLFMICRSSESHRSAFFHSGSLAVHNLVSLLASVDHLSWGRWASMNEDAGCRFPSQLSEYNLQAATEHSGSRKRMTLSQEAFEPHDFGH